MRGKAGRIAEAFLVLGVLTVMALLSPLLIVYELVCDEEDPADSYRRFW